MKTLLPVFAAALLTTAARPQPQPEPAKPVPAATVTPAATRQGSTVKRPRYNFPAASRGDRFARAGLDLHKGRRGWTKYGPMIKAVSHDHGIDPHVLGAYVWVESGFNPNQDYRHGKLRALGLGSVQAQDFPQYTAKQLKEPRLNLTITAREFKAKWKQHDMFGTVMDVWYPAWRRLDPKKIPVIGQPSTYVQAIANRYDVLCRLDGR
jgi:hypothetical protein